MLTAPSTRRRSHAAAVLSRLRLAGLLIHQILHGGPHLAEELWQKLGHERSLVSASWPSWDEELTRDARMEIPVQVMGKVRGRITVLADADRATIEAAALSDAKIQVYTTGKRILRVVTVPGKMVNIVTG